MQAKGWMMPVLRKVDVTEISDSSAINRLKGDWELLLATYGTPSFFLSWLWIGNWIDILPANACLYRVTVYCGGRPEALAIVTRQKIKRNGLFSSNVLALNESLLAGFDMVVEYNGLVGNTENRDVVTLMLSGLKEQLGDWDELRVSAVCNENLLLNDCVLKDQILSPRLVADSDSRYVDLASIREKQCSYISMLSKNTRYNIRRYLRAIERHGQIGVSVPMSVDEALIYFDVLKSYHQAYWLQRGEPGSFANPVWEGFHRNIIRQGFEYGAIQLLKINVGDETVGVVYSLVSSGTVNMVQSGYNYNLFRRQRPGYVCLTKAIEYNLNAGNNVFDLLVGDAQYKKSLATDTVKLKWVMLQRRRVKLSIENFIRALKHKIMGDSDFSI